MRRRSPASTRPARGSGWAGARRGISPMRSTPRSSGSSPTAPAATSRSSRSSSTARWPRHERSPESEAVVLGMWDSYDREGLTRAVPPTPRVKDGTVRWTASSPDLSRLLAEVGLPGRANEAYMAMHRMEGGLTALPDEVRSACARVAGRAEHVRIVEAAIEHYARTLPPEPRRRPTSRAARWRSAPRSRSRSTRSTSAPAGSPPCASRRGCRASARSRPACAPAGRGRPPSWRRSRRPRWRRRSGRTPRTS